MSTRWEVTLLRKGYSDAVLTVEADTVYEARKKALDECGDKDFGDEYDADYEALSAEILEEEKE